MECLTSARRLSLVFEIIFYMIHRFYSFLQAASCTLLNFRHARLQPPLFDRCHHHRVGRKNGRRRAPVNIARFVGRRARRRNCFRDDYDVEIVRPCAAVFSFLSSFVRGRDPSISAETLYRWPSSKVNKWPSMINKMQHMF